MKKLLTLLFLVFSLFSLFSCKDRSTTIEPLLVAEITNMSPVSGYASALTTYDLSWDAIDNTDYYQVQIANSESGIEEGEIYDTSTNSLTPEYSSAHYWYWRVRVIDTDGDTHDWSSISSLTLGWSTITPTILSSGSGDTSDSTPLLGCEPVLGADHYELQVSTSELGISVEDPISSTNQQYSASTAYENGSIYYWRIRSVTAQGDESSWSDINNFTINWGSDGPSDGICYLSELVYIQEHSDLWSGSFTLNADIDLSSITSWTPIGNSSIKFTGVFDGNGNSISNLTIDASDDSQGLFGYASTGSEIKNLTITDVSITSTGAETGGIVGFFQGGAITNCSVEGGAIIGNNQIGGLCGHAEDTTISGCFSSASVQGVSSVGGLIGYAYGTSSSGKPKISTSSSTGSVTNTSGVYTGGLIGIAGRCEIIECFATGVVNGVDYTGGFIGKTGSGGTSSNYPSTILYCYSIGDISGSNYVGGFCGGYYYSDSYTKYSYSKGSVSGTGTYVGAFAGKEYSSTTNCFYDSDATALVDKYATGITSVDLKQSTFTDWDFAITWGITSSINSGYPYLLNNLPN